MGILTDIKNLFILILTLVSIAIYSWGYIGWSKYENSLDAIVQLKVKINLLQTSIDSIKDATNQEIKKKTEREKEYRTAYLFEKKQIDNMQDPDESLGCEEAPQKAIVDVLKLRHSQ